MTAVGLAVECDAHTALATRGKAYRFGLDLMLLSRGRGRSRC